MYRAGPGVWRFLHLDWAVRDYLRGRELVRRGASRYFTAEQIWPRTWFPIMDDVGGGALVLRTFDERRVTSEVSVVSKDGFSKTTALPSLTETVRVWLSAMDAGLAYPDGDQWVIDWQRFPREMQQMPIW